MATKLPTLPTLPSPPRDAAEFKVWAEKLTVHLQRLYRMLAKAVEEAGGSGAPGAQGVSGVANFLVGEAGADGEPGPPGRDGAAGAPGATGNTGALGPAVFMLGEGETGQEGPPGPAGATGATGATGADGAAGAAGATGPTLVLDETPNEEVLLYPPDSPEPWVQRIVQASGSTDNAAGRFITLERLDVDVDTTSSAFGTTIQTRDVLPGTYTFDYFIIWNTGTAGTGIKFQLDFSGTLSKVAATWIYQTTGTAAASGAADQVTTTTAQLIEGWSCRNLTSAMGPCISADTASARMLAPESYFFFRSAASFSRAAPVTRLPFFRVSATRASSWEVRSGLS